MNKLPRWLLFLLVMGLLAAIFGGVMFYFMTQHPEGAVTQKIIKPIVGFASGFKKFENIEESKPLFSIDAADIQSEFSQDMQQAKAEYEGKIIQVNGIVSSIALADTNRVVLLEVDGISNISCQMDPGYNDRLSGVAAGTQVAIKGICNGAKEDDLLGSLDVLMTRCVVVK